MSEKSKLDEQLQDKSYREAFVFSQMSIPISFQIRALREQRGFTQKQLAEKAGMLQPRIVELERPKGKEPNLRTLGRLAAAFDVALIVRFVSFSELVEWTKSFSPDAFVVPSFDDDPGFHEREGTSIGRQTTMAPALVLISATQTKLVSTGNHKDKQPGTATQNPFLEREEHTVDQRRVSGTIKAASRQAYVTKKPSSRGSLAS